MKKLCAEIFGTFAVVGRYPDHDQEAGSVSPGAA